MCIFLAAYRPPPFLRAQVAVLRGQRPRTTTLPPLYLSNAVKRQAPPFVIDVHRA